MDLLSSFGWSEYPSLPVEKECVAGVCHVLQFRNLLVAATTVKTEQLVASSSAKDTSGAAASGGGGKLYGRRIAYRAALFVTDASLKRWHPVATPHVVISHTVDALLVERMRNKLMLVVRPCTKSDGPLCIWSLNSDEQLSLKSTWSPYCVVPAGHRCGTFAVVGNFIVAAGGKLGGGDSAVQRKVDAYDFSRNNWSRWPNLPVPMYAAAPVVFNEKQLVLCGGVVGSEEDKEQSEMGRLDALSINVVGNMPSGQWSMFCHMKSPCLAPSATNVYGILTAHRGGDPGKGDVSWWDVNKKEWRRVTSLPETCVDSAVVEFCGNLVVVGGEELRPDLDVAATLAEEQVEHHFSTKVFVIKILRRNTEQLSGQRKRSIDSLLET